jgi:hypothetical protein
LRIILSSTAGLLLAVQPAAAQVAGLADILAGRASCASVADARASLEHALTQSPPDTSRDAILTSLREVAGRDDLCTELKEAAAAFADQVLAETTAPEQADTEVSSASSALVVAALAEAERRVANLTFNVAPPPRFMTKERISGR